jgi:drug/metabolite transporter (DMT)-like permease
MIIPPAILFNKERIRMIEIIGAFISIAGVALFFL